LNSAGEETSFKQGAKKENGDPRGKVTLKVGFLSLLGSAYLIDEKGGGPTEKYVKRKKDQTTTNGSY